MKPRNEQELFGYLFHIATNTSRELLDEFGTVPPWGVALLPPDFSPRTVSPADRMRSAEFTELLHAVVDDLRRILDEVPDMPAAAIICPLEGDNGKALMVQVETPGASSSFLFPYRKKLLRGWVFDAPEFIEEQFADSVYPIEPESLQPGRSD
jgi:hypothetical protein